MAQLLQRRRWMIPAALALVALGVFVLVWFEPQKLVVDDEVSETLPPVESDVESDVAGEGQPSGRPERNKDALQTLARGDFKPLGHAARGTAFVLEGPSGDLYLRFEDFEVENGPDLRVYLSAASATASDADLGSDFVDLGELKGNIGNQNYEIPTGTDLDTYRSAVVWCKRFSVGFAVADLQ